MKNTTKKLFLSMALLVLNSTAFCAEGESADLLAKLNERDDLNLFRAIVKFGGAGPVFVATPETPKYGPFLPFMVFAPSDAALEKTAYKSIEAIEEIAKNDGYKEDNPLARSEQLRTFVKQHVCMRAKDKKSELKSKYERFDGKALEITDGKIKAKSNTATIIAPDLEATNGMLHVIDAVLD